MRPAQLASVYGLVDKINFPTLFIKQALMKGDVLCMLLFAAAELGIFVVFSLLFARAFKRINSGLRETKRGRSFTASDMKSIKAGSAFSAAYKREFAGYLSNTNYFLNTYIGYIILIIATVALLFLDTGAFLAELGISPMIVGIFAFGFFGMLSPITTPSVSLEAHRLWIYRSSPVSARTVLRAKLAMALTLSLPVMLICSVVAGIALGLDIGEVLAFAAFCVCLTLLTQTSGLATGLALPKLDWTNEITVIKQSGAVVVSIFGGMGVAIVMGIAALLLSFAGVDVVLITLGLAALMLAASALIYAVLMRAGARKFSRLEI